LFLSLPGLFNLVRLSGFNIFLRFLIFLKFDYFYKINIAAMKITQSLIICALIVLASGCKPGTDSTKLYAEIERKFDSGYFTEAGRIADSIKEFCADNKKLILKIDSLVQISERIRLDFSLTEKEFIARINSYAGPVSDTILSEWNKKNWLEWRIIDGEKKYFNRAASNLMLLKTFYENKEKIDLENAADPELIQRLQNTGEIINQSGTKADPVVPAGIKITYTITVHPDAVPDGEKIRCWIPLPKKNHPRQQNIELLSTSSADYIVAPDSAVHSSIYMEGKSAKGVPSIFSVSYRYRSSGQYFKPGTFKVLPYDKTTASYKKYTSEQLPDICFSENIMNLANEIAAPDDDSRTIVRKIYLWFKNNIPWTGAPEYSIIKNIPEYVYSNRRGDCGMQTFLFMSMLRYRGIPVRWQSGWKVPPGYKNLHDWCEVYFEGTGWVPVDVSYDLQNSGNSQLREFFLSGIDSYRLIVNDGVAGPLYPEKKYLRSEPYDFQRGEVEWNGGNLYFDKWDYNMQIEYLK
jgi:hypothetical protein